jgi:hypothetical protein
MDRRQFGFGTTAALFGLSAAREVRAQSPEGRSSAPSGASHSSYFFKNPTFEYTFLISLGRAYHSAGNVGKVLYLSKTGGGWQF